MDVFVYQLEWVYVVPSVVEESSGEGRLVCQGLCARRGLLVGMLAEIDKGSLTGGLVLSAGKGK